MYLISDNIDTLTGMRLAGVDGIVVHEREELRCAIENAMEDKDIGVIPVSYTHLTLPTN